VATEPLFTSIVVAYYRNYNPHPDDPERGICAYCRAILEWLNGRPVLVGSELYFKLSPLQHVRCWCRWEYKVIPAYRINEVITDDDISYSAWWSRISQEAKDAAGEDKWPYYYRERKRNERRERRLTGWGFLLGTGIGLIAAAFKDDDYAAAKKLIRDSRRKGKADDEIVKAVLEKYPDKSGVKALKDFGYI